MFVARIIEVTPMDGYRIWLKFSDGITGEVDLSQLAGKGVFKYWDQNDNFRKVSIVNGRWLAWSDEIDLDADSLYLKVTGEKPDKLFPTLKEDPSYA